MKQFFKSYLTFSKSEKWVIWLYAILIFSTSSFFIYQNWFAKPPEFEILSEKDLPEAFLQNQENKTIALSNKKTEPFDFDPNTASKESLIELGLKPYIAERLLKYRAKVALSNPQDLKKIYGIDTLWVDELSQYMKFENKAVAEQNKTRFQKNENTFYEPKRYPKRETASPGLIYMNRASQSEWMDIKGIGPALSNRILNYKERLGGFISPWQLLDVWGIDSGLIESNLHLLKVDTENIIKLNINTDSFKFLVKHPYIDSKTASLLINYRKQHGDYQSLEDIKKNKGIKPEVIENLKPYLDFN
jgi:competence protein ComEA